MPQVGHEFTTSLSVDQCNQVFRNASKRSRGLSAKMGGVAAKMKGNDQGGFFTPEFSKSFDYGTDGPPILSIGVWIERFSAGAKGAGYSVQMHVWDLGSSRRVNLFAPHGITAVHKPKQLVRKFTESFHEADPKVPLK
jgi:hypothetical protein